MVFDDGWEIRYRGNLAGLNWKMERWIDLFSMLFDCGYMKFLIMKCVGQVAY